MITRVRLLVPIARPSLVVIFCLFAAVGVAQGGAPQDAGRIASCLVPVLGFVVLSVVLNDIADRAIDEINLPRDRGRPLVAGTTTDREFLVIAATGAAVAFAGSVRLGLAASAVMVGGLCLSACYSLRPVRIANRGAFASILLPAGYVGVPYLLGLLSVRSSVGISDLALGAALYLGFIGRILLKDFRDVRGDALFGKRTFLVRHGRRWTCAFSGGCWVVGAVAALAVHHSTPSVAFAYSCQVLFALALLVRLAYESNARREEWLVSAIAIVGRGLVLTLLVHYSTLDARWSSTTTALTLIAVTVVVVGQASLMAHDGPCRSRRSAFDRKVRDLVVVARAVNGASLVETQR